MVRNVFFYFIAVLFLLGCRDDVAQDFDVPVVDNEQPAKITGFFDFRNQKLYRTVKIDGREWMAENLNFQTANSWCYRDSLSYCDMYGRLYSWEDAMKACPDGWRLPANEDWETLRKVAAYDSKAVNDGYFAKMSGLDRFPGYSNRRKSVAGTRLKSVDGWHMAVDTPKGSDELGFSALPGGLRQADGSYQDRKLYAYFWSASEMDSSNAAIWKLWYNATSFLGSLERKPSNGFDAPKRNGLSVRCIR